MRRATACSLLGLILVSAACGGTGGEEATSGGSGGSSKGGSTGKGGAAGQSGAAGKAGGASGTSGSAGGAGKAGSGGVAGGAGSAGLAGGSGKAGAAGATGGAAGTSGASGKGGSAGGPPCSAGQIICDGFSAKTCDGKGGYTDTKSCASGCQPGLGCVVCQPGTGSCFGSMAKKCKADGQGYDFETCDSEIGLTCDPATFTCTGPCSPKLLGSSYIGCEYWPTTVANQVWSNFHFAVAVANPSLNKTANVKVTRGGATVAMATVAPGQLQTIKLPWVPEVKGPDFGPATNVVPEGPTKWAPGGAYRLRTDTPVTVYQFNALEYTLSPSDPDYASCPGLGSVGCNSYSNDASLLLPTNALSGTYRVFTYPAWDQANLPNYAAITATQDGTQVTFTSSTTVQGGGPFPALSPGGTATVTMNAGDVLEVMSNPSGSDISGSLIKADKDVQVIAGHPCRFIPDGTPACDHIEESMLPYETLGADYLITAPRTPGGNKTYEVRLHGVDDGTTVMEATTGQSYSLSAGQTISLGATTADFRFTGNKRFYVSQYMVGQQQAGAGDPAQSNGVPVAQYRSSYTFHAPTSYDTNYVNITATTGAAITLDGAAVTNWEPIGSTGYSVARVQLSMNPVHTVEGGTHSCGIVVYGYGSYTSYMYPGGLDLKKL